MNFLWIQVSTDIDEYIGKSDMMIFNRMPCSEPLRKKNYIINQHSQIIYKSPAYGTNHPYYSQNLPDKIEIEFYVL